MRFTSLLLQSLSLLFLNLFAWYVYLFIKLVQSRLFFFIFIFTIPVFIQLVSEATNCATTTAPSLSFLLHFLTLFFFSCFFVNSGCFSLQLTKYFPQSHLWWRQGDGNLYVKLKSGFSSFSSCSFWNSARRDKLKPC